MGKQRYAAPIFQSDYYYQEKVHGPLDKYLDTHDGNSASPLFKGQTMYERLWFEGYLVPEFSYIRLSYGLGAMDQHYYVKDLETVVGIECPGHPGMPGEHKVREMLHSKAPCFEAGSFAQLEDRLRLKEERAATRPVSGRKKRRA